MTFSADRASHPRSALGFAAALSSLIAVFVSSGTPAPLYERLRVGAELTTFDLALASGGYFLSVLLVLLFLGRLSDYIGRRVVSMVAVLLAAAGCVVLLDVTSLEVLAAGRALQGVACGLASSATAAYVVDLAPRRPVWLATTAAAGSSLVGMTVGAVTSGLLSEYGPAPLQTPFIVAIGLLAICLVLLLLSPESISRRPGALASLRPRLGIPDEIRHLMPAALAVFLSTWAFGSLFQAFSPTILVQSIGTTSTLLAALTFASMMAPYLLGGPIAERQRPQTAQRSGIVAFLVGASIVVLGLHLGSIAIVLVGSVTCGIAQGLAFTGSLHVLLAHTPPTARAGVLATVYLFSYLGAAVPSFIAGRLSTRFALPDIMVGYLVAIAMAAAITFIRFRRPTDQRPS